MARRRAVAWIGRSLFACVVIGGMAAVMPASADDLTRVTAAGQFPQDARLKALRTYNDAYHPWNPPADKAAWEAQKERYREQLLTALGLWPMPEAAPLKPVIHGRVDRGDYYVEKVYFESFPGHYVTGNIYRPKDKTGPLPAVLCPHGHWANGRFYDATEDGRKKELESKAEAFEAGAHSPLQARMVHLARMGCLVFHYDMVGYADSTAIEHRVGFGDIASVLDLQGLMGVQTFNSMRALDFLISLPEVDAARIGVTGASGGGTQTFILCALDSRPAAAFPAVMVGTAMQGGCVCENASYLRIGLNNITYASMFAPKPLAMSAANDWTIDIEKKGLPEMKQIWGFYGAADKVHAKTWPQYGHNYNQPAREMMYAWFNDHLKLGRDDLLHERDFPLMSAKEMAVFGGDHPRPKNELGLEQFKEQWRAQARSAVAAKRPKSAGDLAAWKAFLTPAARVLLTDVPAISDVGPAQPVAERPLDGVQLFQVLLTRKDAREQIPLTTVASAQFAGELVLWVDAGGKSHLLDANGAPTPHVRKLLDAGYAVAGVDPFLTGEHLSAPGAVQEYKVDRGFPGYTFGYNRPLISERVRDIVTALVASRKHPLVKKVHIVGSGEGGAWALLARALVGDTVDRCVVDLGGFSFSKITEATNPNLLPGALRYGGLGGLASLAAPAPLTLSGTGEIPAAEMAPLTDVYTAVGAKIAVEAKSLDAAQLADRFLEAAK